MTDLTEGQRLYAIGDIHGRLDLLRALLARIADRPRRSAASAAAAGLSRRLRRPRPGQPRRHRRADRACAAARCRRASCSATTTPTCCPTCTTPTGSTSPTTGCTRRSADGRRSRPTASPTPTPASRAATHAAFAAAFPPEHLAFLDACGLWRRVGGYLFVHAGIRPGVALEAQDRDDLIWIREPFLSSTADFGFKVVHGHTIVPGSSTTRTASRSTPARSAAAGSPAWCSRARTSRCWSRAGCGPWPVGAGLGLDRWGRSVRSGLASLWPRR